MPTRTRATHSRTRRKKREGAALLIVLFILMMSTATAVYALQSTQFEQRAAGALQQAMRAKYVAESATNAYLAMCLEPGGTTTCFDSKRGTLNADNLTRFGLPAVYGPEPKVTVTSADLVGATYPVHVNDGTSSVLPNDKQLSGGGIASPYVPDFMTTVEKWQVPVPGETRPRFRLVVSTYGILNLGLKPGQSAGGLSVNTATNDVRGTNETVSVTRAFLDVR